jgi:hypothetical protein
MSSVRERVARHRARQRAGAAVLSIVISDEVAVAEWLIAARLLDPVKADDSSALALAVGRMVDTIIAEDKS